MSYILIGKIVNTHGIKGEVKIQSYSDFDQERYQKGNMVYIHDQNKYVPFRVEKMRMHKGMPLVTFIGMHDINEAERYKNCLVYIEEGSRKPLKNGYYRNQLRDLKVIDEAGNMIGLSMDIEETNGAQNNLRIQKNDGEQFLIPFIDEFIRKVDLDNQTIMVHMEEGLL